MTTPNTLIHLEPEAHARLMHMCESLGLTLDQAIERCIATQHYLDHQIGNGWEIVLLHNGRQRREVKLPVAPR